MYFVYLVVEVLYFAISYFGNFAIVALALCLVGLEFKLLNLVFRTLYSVGKFFFLLPFCAFVVLLFL